MFIPKSVWVLVLCASSLIPFQPTFAASRLSIFKAKPPIHIFKQKQTAPMGMSPQQIKAVYRLPDSGGQGTIAIIDAYDSPTIESDLQVFSKQFGLPSCTTANGCFEKHKMAGATSNSSWSYEVALDVEWAHAIAPQAKILLVEAKSSSGTNLLNAVDYARKRKDVVAVSMSWGGSEFSDETTLDSHFTSDHDVMFFASSGDDGAGVSWPAVSTNVVAVGGTSVTLKSTGTLASEKAWTGSGGGVSAYVAQPTYQSAYAIKKSNNMRAVPDVAYNADPNSGFSVYKSTSSKSKNGWYVIGGTSAGAPQWAAIQALGHSASNENFYRDKASTTATNYFRDIVSGSNGDCTYYCDARKHYDYVTGLGSPLSVNF